MALRRWFRWRRHAGRRLDHPGPGLPSHRRRQVQLPGLEDRRLPHRLRHQGRHLNAGTNYFYCRQNLGRRETSGEWTDVWRAKTDDDSGNTNVYVSDVHIKGGDNDAPVPGLPVC
ncbi:hypothetical protein ABZ281_24815 [Streptomyces sp. NPDC006265]|uniref:hypothetical protein n=1 Tax=Streptomyces sp. NPDC006265 TaxID=3156740 RepID=UPI0033AAE379